MCLPSCASLPHTAAVSVRTFLHFKAPRRLMSYPRIMKGETLLGFEIGTERVSSSHLSLFPLSWSHIQGTAQHFHLRGSSTGLLISRSFERTRCFLSFFLFITHAEKSLIVPFWPIKTGANTSHSSPLCWDVFQMKNRGHYCCSSNSLITVHRGFSHLLASRNSPLKLSHTFTFLTSFSWQTSHSDFLFCFVFSNMPLGPPPHCTYVTLAWIFQTVAWINLSHLVCLHP